MIRTGEFGRTLHQQVMPGIVSAADPIIGLIDNPQDAALIVWLLNTWLADPNHKHWYVPATSPTGAWMQCPCGDTFIPEPGTDVKIGPREDG